MTMPEVYCPECEGKIISWDISPKKGGGTRFWSGYEGFATCCKKKVFITYRNEKYTIKFEGEEMNVKEA